MVPWLALSDQALIFPNQRTFERPAEQEECMREWIKKRTGLAPDFEIVWYPGAAHSSTHVTIIVGFKERVERRQACMGEAVGSPRRYLLHGQTPACRHISFETSTHSWSIRLPGCDERECRFAQKGLCAEGCCLRQGGTTARCWASSRWGT